VENSKGNGEPRSSSVLRCLDNEIFACIAETVYILMIHYSFKPVGLTVQTRLLLSFNFHKSPISPASGRMVLHV